MDTDYFDFDSNPELLDYFTAIFKQYDKSQEGTMSLEDIGTALRVAGLAPSEDDIKLWKEAHDDGTGRIPPDTFFEIVKKSANEFKGIEALKDAFRALDPTMRGFLPPHVLRYYLTNFGEALTEEEAADFLAETVLLGDVDSEGNVNYENFSVKLLLEFLSL